MSAGAASPVATQTLLAAEQTLRMYTSPDGHTAPQAPQLEESVSVNTQDVPHSVQPGSHEIEHWPAVQNELPEQAQLGGVPRSE